MPKSNARSQSITSQESYSAVIIADLVAEVPISLSTEVTSVKSAKEETNLGYDGHMDGETPAVVDVDAAEVNLHSSKSNGAGISRGVILNAVQFGQSESKTKGDDKPIPLTNALSAQVNTQPVSEPSGFKDMSFLRKVAFGFSFLPSVLFVLCFAIILPCKVPKPCVEEMWIKTLKNTEITSRLEVPQNIVLTILENGITSYYMALNAYTGERLLKEEIPTAAIYLGCGNVINKDEKHCIIMEETGEIYAFNSTNGTLLWNVTNDEQSSLPVILPACNKDGVEEIAVAVSNSKIKVLYNGNIISSSNFVDQSQRGCDSTPKRLMSWTKDNTTDIIFTCQRAGRDYLIKVPQNAWCMYDKTSPGNTLLLHHPEISSSKGYILHPTEDGLVLWSGDEISMLQRDDGSVQWKTSNHSHSDKNRFVLHGNFIGESKQVALLSSDISSKLEVTILNSTDGSIMKSTIFPNSEAAEVTQIQGKERDFALILLKKIKKDFLAEAFTQINDISTTIITYLSNEELNNTYANYTNGVQEEITFLDFDGSFHSIRELKSICEQGTACKSIMTATHAKDDSLNIYLLRTTENTMSKTAEIRNIGVINWDISVSKSPKCALE